MSIVQQVKAKQGFIPPSFSGSKKASNPKVGPASQGSQVKMWKQDPTVEAIGIRKVYIPTPVSAGPKDTYVRLANAPVVSPDANGNFLVDHVKQPKEFDAVHTYAVVQQVRSMFERSLKRLGVTKPLQWQWGAQPITVYPHAGETPNAYYSRQEKVLKFFYFASPKNKQEKIYTCRSYDIVAHEGGHAILDAIKPGLLSSWHPQSGGLHESFGDLSAIFNLTAQLDMCEAIIVESKANLYDKGFFPALAEQFGDALGRVNGLRNADNNLKLSDVSNEVHDISQVFTGAIYNILADMFQASLNPATEDPAFTLYKTSEHVKDLVLGALLKTPARDVTYKQMAEQMIALESNPKYQEFIRKRFTEREVLGARAARLSITPQELSWKKCCKTLQRNEFTQLASNAVKEAKSLGLTG